MERQQRLLLSLFGVGAAAMLLGALGDREYSYYTLMRWVVSFAAVLVAIIGLRRGQVWAVGVFAFVAILFNPLAPIKLSRDLWLFIDIAAAVLFLLAVAFIAHPGAVGRVVVELKRHENLVALAVGIGIIVTVTLGVLAFSSLSSTPTLTPTPTPTSPGPGYEQYIDENGRVKYRIKPPPGYEEYGVDENGNINYRRIPTPTPVPGPAPIKPPSGYYGLILTLDDATGTTNQGPVGGVVIATLTLTDTGAGVDQINAQTIPIFFAGTQVATGTVPTALITPALGSVSVSISFIVPEATGGNKTVSTSGISVTFDGGAGTANPTQTATYTVLSSGD